MAVTAAQPKPSLRGWNWLIPILRNLFAERDTLSALAVQSGRRELSRRGEKRAAVAFGAVPLAERASPRQDVAPLDEPDRRQEGRATADGPSRPRCTSRATRCARQFVPPAIHGMRSMSGFVHVVTDLMSGPGRAFCPRHRSLLRAHETGAPSGDRQPDAAGAGDDHRAAGAAGPSPTRGARRGPARRSWRWMPISPWRCCWAGPMGWGRWARRPAPF